MDIAGLPLRPIPGTQTGVEQKRTSDAGGNHQHATIGCLLGFSSPPSHEAATERQTG